jgi:AraC family transcriptional regulator, transcriptional activator of pobA
MTQQVPAYAPYEEAPQGQFPDDLHIETIMARSAIHGWRIRPHRHADQFFPFLEGGGTAWIETRARLAAGRPCWFGRSRSTAPRSSPAR